MSQQKLILAVLHEDDYDITVEELNRHDIYVTKLSSTGGFLKKKNITAMIGVSEEQLDTAISILKTYAGRRQTTSFTVPTTASYCPGGSGAVPMEAAIGGTTVFVMSIDSINKY